MEIIKNGIVYSIYQVRNEWKVAHGVMIAGRVRKGKVQTFTNALDATNYVISQG